MLGSLYSYLLIFIRSGRNIFRTRNIAHMKDKIKINKSQQESFYFFQNFSTFPNL